MVGYLIFWGIALIVLTLIELATFQLVAIWFAAGSLVSFFCALANTTFWVQLLAFVIVSALLLLLTRPIVRKLWAKPRVPTNADKTIGTIGTVIQTVDNDAATGRVNADGLDWSAKSDDNSIIAVGERVFVKSIEGVKLIVSKPE